MSDRKVIDPLTRVQGHLRLTVDLEPWSGSEPWIVRAAYNSATMFRGVEAMLVGRDPREVWQLASRICGVCPTAHGITSVKAIEAALGLPKVPKNARLVRNMLEAAQIAFDHIVWFYQLNLLDYVDVTAAAEQARPSPPALKKLQGDLRGLVRSGQPSPLVGGYEDHPACRLEPDEGLELLGHYVEALSAQRNAASASAALGGKFPMLMNLAPGGLAHMPDIPAVLDYQARMRDVADFVERVMVPDLLTLAGAYGHEISMSGHGHGNYLSWGVLDAESQDPYDRLFPRGVLRPRDAKARRVDPKEVRIFTGRSFFADGAGEGKHPLDSRQAPVQYEGFDDPDGKYDWTQAARLGTDAEPMESGPLAQVLIAYLAGQREVVREVERLSPALTAVGFDGALLRSAGAMTLRPAWLQSALGRMAARVIKVKVVADQAIRWSDELMHNVGKRDRQYFAPKPIPYRADGVGAWDAPRGALCHWARLDESKVADYAIVAPTTWNLSPRDDEGVPGPLEKALEGTRVADPDRPLEVTRIVHSFDPCMACAVHVLRSGKRP